MTEGGRSQQSIDDIGGSIRNAGILNHNANASMHKDKIPTCVLR